MSAEQSLVGFRRFGRARMLRNSGRSSVVRWSLLVMLVEVLSIIGGCFLIGKSVQALAVGRVSYLGLGGFWAFVFVLLNIFDGSYRAALLLRNRRGVGVLLSNWTVAWSLTVLGCFLLGYRLEGMRGGLILLYLGGLPVLAAIRYSFHQAFDYFSERDRERRETVALLRIGRQIMPNADFRDRFRALCARTIPAGAPMATLEAGIQEFVEAATASKAGRILISVDVMSNSLIRKLLPYFQDQHLPVALLLESGEAASLEGEHAVSGDVFVVPVGTGDRRVGDHVLKKLMDVSISGLAILLLSPLLLLVALAIRLESPGPVIFRQARYGLHGRKFTIFKFRSMAVQENGSEVLQARRNDPRVTTVGRFIRATSLDELPQLFNVLFGEMSLVGPRPHAVAHDDHFRNLIPDYSRRWLVKPGITGRAQVLGFRGETPTVESMAARIEQDIWYVDNWSPMTDLGILLGTVSELFRNRNVY